MPPTRPSSSAEHTVSRRGRWVVERYDEVPSTNAECLADPRPGRVVAAALQTRGRGRLGRSWSTPAGSALAVSAVVAAPGPERLGWVPLAAGLALRDAVADCTGLEVVLKWPNDVLAGPGPEEGRKIAGTLCESWGAVVVVGTGANVSTAREDLPVPQATSLALCGAETTPDLLLAAYLDRLGTRLDLLDAAPGALRDAYRAACGTLGRDVVVEEPGGSQRTGRAVDVDPGGRLVLDTPQGRYAVSAGDIVHARTSGTVPS